MQNRIYRGETVQGRGLSRRTRGIVDGELWSRVQCCLEENGIDRKDPERIPEPNHLTGILPDANGQPMTPTHA